MSINADIIYPRVGNNFRDQVYLMQHPNYSAFADYGAGVIKDFSLDPEYFKYLAFHTGRSVDELVGFIADSNTNIADSSDFYLIGEKAYHVLGLVKGFRSFNPANPCVLSLWDFAGQARFDIAKSKLRLLTESNYSSIFMDITHDSNKAARKDFEFLNDTLSNGHFKSSHSFMINLTFLDKLAVNGVFNERKLERAYKNINDEYEVTGELVSKLKNFTSSDGVNFKFLGAKVSSGRPCLGFLNANIDLITTKYFYDITNNLIPKYTPVGDNAKLSYLGEGAQGKSQNFAINDFLQKSNCNNWLNDGMTIGVKNLASRVYRESFFDGWYGESGLNVYANGDFPFNLEMILRSASSFNPSSFGLVLKGEYKDSDKCFYPSANLLNRLRHSWVNYALDKINRCDSFPVFQEYFGIDKENYFRTHMIKTYDSKTGKSEHYPIMSAICDALTLDEAPVKSALSRIGVKEEFIK